MTINDFFANGQTGRTSTVIITSKWNKNSFTEKSVQIYSESVFGPPISRMIVYLWVYTWQQLALLVMDSSLVLATNNKALYLIFFKSMDVVDKWCWRQLLDVGVEFGCFCHQHLISFNIRIEHQHSDSVIKLTLSPTPLQPWKNFYLISKIAGMIGKNINHHSESPKLLTFPSMMIFGFEIFS